MMKISINIFIFCLLITGIHSVVSAQQFPYWPGYNKTSISGITPETWIQKDTIRDDWDWSLPDGITPAPKSKLILARTWNLSLNNVYNLPTVNFSCNLVVAHWLKWKDIEPTKDNYKWNELKDMLDLAKSKGYKSVIRILSCRVNEFAPAWLNGLGINTISYGGSKVDFDPADPVFHQHYLDLVADLGASGIAARDDVVGLFVGYSSQSWGDEGIGPYGEGNPEANDKVQHVKERLDAWAAITNGMRGKMVMGGYSNYGFSLGFGIRRGFVEHYMYHTPDAVMGQLLDANNYMYVDEDNPIIANNLYNGEENEEYDEKWATAGTSYRFGTKTDGFPYRYFSSNIRLLQMRCNTVLYNTFSLMPKMLAWVGLELGRTRQDTPDAWCFLRETYIRNGVYDNVKNFERWLYQRDTPGYETQAVIPIDKNYDSWMYDANKPYDYIARKGLKIGFAADDVVFPTNKEHDVAIKVSYIDNVEGTLKLVYHNNSGPQEKTINTTGEDKVRTATFFVTAKFDATGFNYDFELQCETGKEVPVSFVRVIKAKYSYKEQSSYGGINHKIPGIIEAEHYDVGGESIAYHDDGSKEGELNFRPDDFVDVVAKSSTNNDSVVSFIKEGEWLEYTVDAEAGRYDLTLFYFSGETGGDVVVSLYGEILDTINGFGNQGLDVRDSITVENILLSEGGKDRILRLDFINNPTLQMDAIKFTRLFTPVTGVSLFSCPSDTILTGNSHQLTANAEPYYANNSKLIWESSDEAIATVDSMGKVTAISDGTAIISVTTEEGGYSQICNIVVQSEIFSVYGVTIAGCPWSILQTGDTLQLIANVAPENATDKTVTWKSSNPEVAKVDETGRVYANSQGSVKITLTTTDGGYSSTCNIGVMGTATSADLNQLLVDKMKVYPNPVSDKLYLEFSDSESEKIINIYNTRGQLLTTKNTNQQIVEFNISKYKTEVLLLMKIIYGNTINSFKIMVQ